TALGWLDCPSNQLTSLDVSQNTALWRLDCFNNQLDTLDVSHNAALTMLECYGNQINGVGMEALVAGLPTVDVDANWGEKGEFYVIDLDSDTEQNVITTTQVATARDKNWKVYGWTNDRWQEYDGSAEVVMPGDVNGDGIVNVNDITVIVAKTLGGNPQPFIFEAADLDHDGVIGVTDITALVKLLL
ncbi:MAG: hypothetical protein IK092_06170, partial [Muribaculaceae bacterium]|nr:hypothetical protein [Muribaculaceae bacterium]